MLEPQNDEERKALRLKNRTNGTSFDGFTDELSRMWWAMNLAEARAIVREELGAGSVATPYDAREFELAQVRADITRTANVLEALVAIEAPTGEEPDDDVSDEIFQQKEVFLKLLARERELMAKTEPEGGSK